MIRFITTPPNGGIPYASSDFFTVLQSEHLKSYRSHLDAINDVPLTDSATMSRGIIVKGCEVVTTSPMVMDFSNSMIYLPGITGPGDFLEPLPSIVSPYTISSSNFWLVATYSFDNRKFYTGNTHSAAEKRYFEVTTTNPGNITNIQFNIGKTSRRYKRVLKYKMDNLGDIFITSTLTNFDTNTGLGSGDKFGYALCNGQNGTPNLRGRYILGYDRLSPTTPVDNTLNLSITNPLDTDESWITIKDNYGQIGNFGGGYTQSGNLYPSAFAQLPFHTHLIDKVSNIADVYHAHKVDGTDLRVQDGNPPPDSNSFQNLLYGNTDNVQRQTSYIDPPPQGLGGLGNHKHTVNAQGGNQPHETRPPYIVLAYYQKIQI